MGNFNGSSCKEGILERAKEENEREKALQRQNVGKEVEVTKNLIVKHYKTCMTCDNDGYLNFMVDLVKTRDSLFLKEFSKASKCFPCYIKLDVSCADLKTLKTANKYLFKLGLHPTILKLNLSISNKKNSNSTIYSKPLTKILPFVQKSVEISWMNISKRNFQSWILKCGHIPNLKYFFCSIEVLGLQFKDTVRYKIENLVLHGCRTSTKVGMLEYQEGYTDIIRSISSCSMRDSLKTLQAGACAEHKTRIQKILEEFGMDRVKMEGF
ncbi:unnamed protein product [Moneuplotes crassus]|uniref:Uncharacterized protein n=1 Tax=Euplotes crassus TaxID=5936 RepID=A0AAD2D301_EUPCR|nr:unnamed protein product [Moneuplotes crassus]